MNVPPPRQGGETHGTSAMEGIPRALTLAFELCSKTSSRCPKHTELEIYSVAKPAFQALRFCIEPLLTLRALKPSAICSVTKPALGVIRFCMEAPTRLHAATKTITYLKWLRSCHRPL